VMVYDFTCGSDARVCDKAQHAQFYLCQSPRGQLLSKF